MSMLPSPTATTSLSSITGSWSIESAELASTCARDQAVMQPHLNGRAGASQQSPVASSRRDLPGAWTRHRVRRHATRDTLKGAGPVEIERALRAVAAGEVLLAPAIAANAVAMLTGSRRRGPDPFPSLTEREREVLELVAEGLDNRRIAQRLALSEKTVRNHLSTVLTKLGVADRAAAIAKARDAGLGSR